MPSATVSLESMLPQVLFTHLYRCESGWSMGKRFHPECHEMFFVLEGKGSFTLDETEYPAEAGDVFLIKPRQSHCAAADSFDPYLYYSLHYSLVERQGPADIPVLEERPLLDIFFSIYYKSLTKVKVSEISEVRRVIEKMEMEKIRKTVGYRTMRRAYLLELLTVVARAALQTEAGEVVDSPDLRNHELLVVNQIKRYLADNLTQRITLQEIANATHLSPHYCCSLFKKVSGYTIFQYLDRLRIERAKMLLRHSHLNVTETAEALGYQNVYYFSRVFKKVTGVSPTQFVAQLIGKNNQLDKQA